MIPQENKIITFGCRLNLYESQVMGDLTKQAGLTNTIIINTCAVTAEAERQALQAIRRARREHPTSKIIVTGCAAQINPDKFSALKEVDQVIGNQEKMKLESFSQLSETPILVNDIMSVQETASHMISSFDGKTRAFVEIQNGCDHRCTYCIIPYGRGNSRSIPLGTLITQIKKLVQEGFQEIVLTGVDVTSYGGDLPGTPTFGQMVKRLLSNVPELKRLRLSSLDPVEVDEELFQVIGSEKRLMPSLHISLQAGDNLILKRMKRRHSREDVIEFCQKVRALRPDIVFGADFIVGFPTETEEMFQNTLKLVEECNISYLHVFPYSARPGTPAARMPQVHGKIIKERAQRLRALGDKMVSTLFQSLEGQEAEIIIEKDYSGRTEHFAPLLPNEKREPGTLVRVRIEGRDGNRLQGIIL